MQRCSVCVWVCVCVRTHSCMHMQVLVCVLWAQEAQRDQLSFLCFVGDVKEGLTHTAGWCENQ